MNDVNAVKSSYLGLLLLKARTAAVLAALIGLLACEGAEAPNALGLSPAWMINMTVISTMLLCVLILRQKFLYTICISQLCPSTSAITAKKPMTSCFCRSRSGHAHTSIDDESGAVAAGGYGIDPQGEAALLAEV